MKNTVLLFILVLLLTFGGCSGRSDRRLLERADSALSVDPPDTAWIRSMLDSASRSAGAFSEPDRMYYVMLLADLQNKSFAPLPGDSLMRAMVDYYDRHGDANERMRAHYLLGSFYRDRKSVVEAQRQFHQAIECADTVMADCNFSLLARVYTQLADLYRHRSAYSVEMYDMSKRYALIGKDTLMAINAADNQIECYRDMNRHDTILDICSWCRAQYHKIGKEKDGNTLWLAMADSYVELVNFDSAAYCLRQYEQTSDMADSNFNVYPGMNRESYYYYKGHYFLEKGELDSALVFYYKELHTNKETYVRGACKNLYLTYDRMGNKDSAYKYLQLYNLYKERRDSTEATTQLQELQVHFDLNRERQRTEKFQSWVEFLFSLAVILTLAWGCWLIYAYRRDKRNRRQVESLMGAIERLEQEAADKRRQLNQLNSTNEEKAKHIARLQDELYCTEENLKQQRVALAKLDRRLHAAADQFLVTDELGEAAVVNYLRDAAAEGKAMAGESKLWDAFYVYAHEHASSLTQAMRAAQLSEKEMRVCLLVWTHFSPKDLATLLATSKQNISSVRSRLHEKMFGEKGSSRDFDERIRRLAPYPPPVSPEARRDTDS